MRNEPYWNPKKDKRRLDKWRAEYQGTMIQNNMIDRNPDSWIALDTETCLAGLTYVYRYEAEMLNQAVPGVILSMCSIYNMGRLNAYAVVVVALDNLGVGYYISIEDVYSKSMRINAAGAHGDYVLVPISHMERRYLPTVRLHNGK